MRDDLDLAGFPGMGHNPYKPKFLPPGGTSQGGIAMNPLKTSPRALALGALFADTTKLRTHSSFIPVEDTLNMTPSQAFAASRSTP